MADTCVKGLSSKSVKGFRTRAEQFLAAQQYYHSLMTSDGYRDVNYDRSQVQSALKQQARDVAEFNRAKEKPRAKPDLPELDIIDQGDLAERSLHIFAGDVVENVSVDVAVGKLGFEPVPYEQPYHGVDAFCKKDGKYYAIESKSRVVPNATKGLKTSREHGDIQCSDSWLERLNL